MKLMPIEDLKRYPVKVGAFFVLSGILHSSKTSKDMKRKSYKFSYFT